MSVSKSERILNLFFVLLNSKRPIPRHEIKQRVSGYEECESETAFERMFERDKDELRNTGIKIDTVPVDPLFDDELGYQVDSNTFLTKTVEWTPSERAILSLASTTWHRTEFENLAKSATLKTGGSINAELIEENTENYSGELLKFRSIMKSLNTKSIMDFWYVSFDDNEPKSRQVIPRKLYRQGDNWYFDAYELISMTWKTYQTSRIVGEIVIKPASAIELNLLKKDNNQTLPRTVRVEINQNASLISHITGGIAIGDKTIDFNFFDEKSFAKYLLRFSSIIVSIDNEAIREHYRKYLKDFMKVLSDD
jgi:predicted DNA-binding transcriptional regulator YafY